MCPSHIEQLMIWWRGPWTLEFTFNIRMVVLFVLVVNSLSSCQIKAWEARTFHNLTQQEYHELIIRSLDDDASPLVLCFMVPKMWKLTTLNLVLSVIWYSMSLMATFWMTLLMNKRTNSFMDDGWVHPLAKTLPSLVSKILMKYCHGWLKFGWKTTW